VVAVLVAHDGEVWLPRSLAAVRASTVRPSVVVAVDTGSVDGTPALLAADAAVDDVVTLDRNAGVGAAVAAGLSRAVALVAQLPDAPASTWLWLLHDDCAPEPSALAYLLDAVTGAPMIAVAGPKLLDWTDSRRLVEVGVVTARIGSRSDQSLLELDQGQHDGRSDVIAVSTAGMLIRRDVLEAVRRFDPALPLLGDDVDLCRRVRLAGHRVVVVPAARVAHAGALTAGSRAGDALRSRRDRRPAPVAAGLHRYQTRHWLYLRLVAAPLPLTLALLVWLALATLGSAVLDTAAGNRQRALGSVLAWWDVVVRPWRIASGMYRLRRTRRSRAAAEPASLRPGRLESARDLAESWTLARRLDGAALADRLRRLRPIVVATTATAAASWAAMRSVGDRSAAVGPDLPIAAGAITTTELWHRAMGSVTAVGSAPVVPDPAAAVWAALSAMAAVVRLALPGEATLTSAVSLWSWAVVPVGVVTAWLALRELVRGRLLVTVLAVGWAALPLAAAAVAVPYATSVDLRLVHALLPLTAWGLLLAVRRAPPDWRPAALGIAAMATAAVVALQPSVWPVLCAIGAAALVVLHLGRRARRSVIAAMVSVLALLLAPALLWPGWALTALRAPAVALGAPAHRDPAAGLAALAMPGSGLSLAALAVLGVAAIVSLLGVVLAVLRRGASASGWTAGILGALLAVWCLALSGTSWSAADPHSALDPPWACVLLVLTAAAALAVSGAAADRPPGPRRMRVPVALLLAATGAVVGTAGMAVPQGAAALPTWGAAMRPGLPVPAVLDAASQERSGVLTITGLTGAGAVGDGDLAWSVDRGEWGPGAATAAMGAAATPKTTAGPVAPLVADAVADVVTRLLADPQPASAELPGALAELAIGWVVIDGDAPPALAAGQAVASRAGLSPVSQAPTRSVWRVDDGGVASWARLLPPADGGSAQSLPATAAGLDLVIAPGEAGRMVTLATEDATAWTATIDGRVVTPRALTRGRVGIDVGSGGGHLLVMRAEVLSLPGGRLWWLGPVVLLAAAVAASRPRVSRDEQRPPDPAAPASARGSLVAVTSVVALVLIVASAWALGRDPAVESQLPRVVRLGAATALAHCPGDAVVTRDSSTGTGQLATTRAVLPAGSLAGDHGNQVGVATGGALAGTIAMTACPVSGSAGWAFAGGTGTGERPRLVLDNPGAVPAEYAVELLTATGRQSPAAGGTGLVRAGEVQAVAVDALLPGEGVLAVQVRTTSGTLAGTLRDSAVSGLLSAGVDDEALAQPGTRLVVPALVTGANGQVTPVINGGGPGDAGASYLAMAVPGLTGGVATVTIVAATDRGAAPPAPVVVALAAGSVATVLLDLPPGTYSVWIDSDVPVVAAARSSVATAGSAPADLGWAAAVQPDDIAGRQLAVPVVPDDATTVMIIGTSIPQRLIADLLDDRGGVLRSVRLDSGPSAPAVLELTGTPGAAAVRLKPARPGTGGAMHGAIGLIVTGPPVAEQSSGSRPDPAGAATPRPPRGLATATVAWVGADASLIQLAPR